MRDDYIKTIIENINVTKRRVMGCVANLPKDLPISSPGEWAVAHLIYDEDGISTKELAARLSVTGSAVSQSVKTLEQAGLVTRTIDAHDKRLSHLHLSPQYKEVFAEMERIMIQNMAEAFTPLTDTELKTLATLHSKINSK